jgi:hypothetical protein
MTEFGGNSSVSTPTRRMPERAAAHGMFGRRYAL